MNKSIKDIADRKFGDNEFMVGFEKGKIDKIAGNLKANQWKEHFNKFKGILRK